MPETSIIGTTCCSTNISPQTEHFTPSVKPVDVCVGATAGIFSLV